MADIMVPLFKLLVFDAIVLIAFFALLIPLKGAKWASFAVLKRDFFGYFTNPTGYVFICVFVLLSSLAAFGPEEFFNNNLANLYELNRWFPLIMLIFIPAITMSVWSDERREGTDELLLTIPASDLDIVVGKYLAIVSIFTVALFFSQITNFLVLLNLSVGDLDVGLFITTYIGYWFIGVAMLALGMAASFLTANLTVSFILGALINAPLVMLFFADRLVAGEGIARQAAWWSYVSRFSDFGRGVFSFASASFFVLVAVLGVYLSIIFIGKRHWQGGRDGKSMLPHYILRGVAVAVIALGASKFFSYHDWFRFDATEGKVSSLSQDTKTLLRDLDAKQPVLVEAFISASVPEQFVRTKVDMINMLREVEALAGSNVQIRLHDNMETFTEEAALAEEQYGITPQTVMTESRGTLKQEELFLSAAFSCGLERVVIPFFSSGIPVEYELVRSITTAANASRLKIGIVKTSVEMFGGVNMQTFQRNPKQLIVEELEKQYEVEEIDPSAPIPDGVYDCVLVVQPSSLNPQGMNNLVSAIQNGVPTAIFEDPFPAMMRGAPATGQPRPRQGGGPMGMMGGGGPPPEPKGDIRRLWSVLGIEMVGKPGTMDPRLYDASVISQEYNPYEGQVQVASITPEWVFISPDAPGVTNDAFNEEDGVTSGLSQLLFMFPGAIRDVGTRKLNFTPLVKTGDETSEIGFGELQQSQANPQALNFLRKSTRKHYVVGARIRGKAGSMPMSDAGSPLLAQVPQPPPLGGSAPAGVPGAPSAGPVFSPPDVTGGGESRDREIHVVYISDIDLLSSEFMQLRSQASEGGAGVKWDFDNVTFVLNILDSLAGDDRLLEIRKRKTRHSTLKEVSLRTEAARELAMGQMKEFNDNFEKTREDAQEKLEKTAEEGRKKIEELRLQAQAGGAVDRSALTQEAQRQQLEDRNAQRQFSRQIDKLEQERDQKLKVIERELALDIRKVQTGYKLRAALIPPLPPLLIGLLVWLYRRRREQEGVIASRRR